MIQTFQTVYQQLIAQTHLEHTVLNLLKNLQKNRQPNTGDQTYNHHMVARMIVIVWTMIITGYYATDILGYDDYAKLLNTPSGEPCVLNVELQNSAGKAEIIIPAKTCQRLKQFEPQFKLFMLTNAPSYDYSDFNKVAKFIVSKMLLAEISQPNLKLDSSHMLWLARALQHHFKVQMVIHI